MAIPPTREQCAKHWVTRYSIGRTHISIIVGARPSRYQAAVLSHAWLRNFRFNSPFLLCLRRTTQLSPSSILYGRTGLLSEQRRAFLDRLKALKASIHASS